MTFFWSERLDESPDPLLKEYYADNLRRDDVLEALHAHEKAQLIALSRSPLVPADAIKCMAEALRTMERSGVAAVRGKQWNVIHGGEEYLRSHCGEGHAGWIHLGRSSPNIRVVAWRLVIRRRLVETMRHVLRIRDVLLRRAADHVATPMPGYAYQQQLDVTTFGFYLMSWLPMLERDFQRHIAAFEHANLSATAVEGGFGTQFDVDAELIDQLLGFDGRPRNSRDAIRNYDYVLDALWALSALHNGLGRLALDLVIWSSQEHRMVRPADKYCISSSFAPQVRAPYVLEYVNGTSGTATGALVAGLAVSKTASDQLEPATLLPTEYLRAQEDSCRALKALVGLVGSLIVNEDRMAELAAGKWAQAPAILGFLVHEKGLPYRVAHQAVSVCMRTVEQRGLDPASAGKKLLVDAVNEYSSSDLEITDSEWERILDPRWSVAQKRYRGGSSEEEVERQVAEGRQRLSEDTKTVELVEHRLETAGRELDTAFAALT